MMDKGNIKLKVKRFADALAFALYDRELELRGEKLIYYLDTDVILSQIMGFQSKNERHSSAEQQLVRSLFSCGHLGTYSTLRPHALELNEKLRHLRIPSDQAARAILRKKAQEFLKSTGIRAIMSQLYNIAVGKNSFKKIDVAHRNRLFIELLQDCAGDTFSFIEQVNGTWWQRLKRYIDDHLLCFENMGPEIYELLSAQRDQLKNINWILRKSRSQENQSINVFQDAAALAILHNFILERDRQQSGPIVRFYTETMHLRKDILKNPELSQFLSYRKPLTGDIDMPINAELVLRDAGYFIMRAWFSDLIPGTTVLNPNAFESLKTISRKLDSIIFSDKNNLEENHEDDIKMAIEKIEIYENTLSDLIDKFEKLTIMDSIWVGGRIPEGFKKLKDLAKWTEVFEFAEKKATKMVLFEEIEDARKELENKVSLIKNWKEDFKLILLSSNNTRARVKGRIVDVMRDLGLVRWGYSLGHDEKQSLVENLEALLQHENDQISLLAGEVAVLMEEARSNPRTCLLVCGILWALGLFHKIVVIVEDCKTNSRDQCLPSSLLVIQAAAKGRSGDLNSKKRSEIVATVLKLEEELDENERVGVLLGIGYVLYHAWKWENTDDVIPTLENEKEESLKRKKNVKKLAKKCFALGEEASKKIPSNEIAWAFAINHCAYVGIVTKTNPKKTENYFEKLFRLENTPRWNFRFDDTVGTYYYLKAKRKWERTKKEKKKGLDLSILISQAEKYYKNAILGDIGDIDAEYHYNLLISFKLEYEQFKET